MGRRVVGSEPRQTFSFRFEPALIVALDELAAASGMTRTAVVESLIRAAAGGDPRDRPKPSPECEHPRSARRNLGYMTKCADCGASV